MAPMDERGASPECQQDRRDAVARQETFRWDRELERMIRAVECSPLDREEYVAEIVAVVQRHTAAMVAALARTTRLIDHVERRLRDVQAALPRCSEPTAKEAPHG